MLSELFAFSEPDTVDAVDAVLVGELHWVGFEPDSVEGRRSSIRLTI